MIGMEIFGSGSKTTLETCIERVKESSLFVLIIGFRYGSIVGGIGKSITQIEYETEVGYSIPVLVIHYG